MNLNPYTLVALAAVIVALAFILWTMLALSSEISREEEAQEEQRQSHIPEDDGAADVR